MVDHAPATFKNPDSLVLINGFKIHFKEKYRKMVKISYGSYHSGDARLEGLVLSVYCGSVTLGISKFTGEVNMAGFEIKTDHVKEIRRSDGSPAWKNEENAQSVSD